MWTKVHTANFMDGVNCGAAIFLQFAKGHGNFGAFAGRAGQVDGAFMEQDAVFYQGQPQTVTGNRACVAFLTPVKAFKDTLLIFLGDAFAGITHP